MRRALIWTLLGAVIFIVLLLVMAPAQLIAMLLNRDALQLQSPLGSLWSGSGTLIADQQPLGDLSWTFRPRALLTAHLAFDLRLEGAPARATAELDVGVGSLSIAHLNGLVSNALLARAASHYDVDLQGDVRLREVSLHATRRQIVAAGGELDWPGGHINYVLNSQPYAANVGPLHGRLRQRTGRLWLEVTTPATQLDALRFTLSADGWGSAAATRQFMASAGFPWPGNAAPGEFVLEVQEKLF